jgi:CRISPR/Cas system-associated protein Cas5 (RAMP superfamily)
MISTFKRTLQDMHLKEIKSIVSKVVQSLSANNLDEIYQNDLKKEMPVAIIKEILEDYGGKVTQDDQSLDDMRFYFIDDDTVKVDYDLIINNSESDLTLTMYIQDLGDQGYRYYLRDLHIL